MFNVRDPNERRVVIIGKTGNGKRATGNTLLGRRLFKSGMALNAVTEKCLMGDGIISQKSYKIVDTPGLAGAGTNIAKEALEVQRSLQLCPEPHVFLLIFKVGQRLTNDDEYTVKLMQVIFGKDFFSHCIVVFTCGGAFQNDEGFNRFCSENTHFMKVADACMKRVVRIENSHSNTRDDLRNRLMEMIEDVCDNGMKTFKMKSLHVFKKTFEEHFEHYVGALSYKDQLDAIKQRLEENIAEEIKKYKMIAASSVSLFAFVCGVTGYNLIAAPVQPTWFEMITQNEETIRDLIMTLKQLF